jgi:hypothetical protein
MRASESDLEYYDEEGFNKAEIMKQAHRMAAASGSWAGTYAERLADKLSRKWDDAREAKKRIEQSGGVEKVRRRLNSTSDGQTSGGRASDNRSRDERGAEKPSRDKSRTLVPARRRRQMKKAIQRDDEKTFDGFGKTWKAGSDIASIHGSQYLGCEGQKVCYMYYYEA